MGRDLEGADWPLRGWQEKAWPEKSWGEEETPTSILGLDGDDALTLWPEALSSPGLHLELVGHVLTEARHSQPALRVVSIHPECGGWPCMGRCLQALWSLLHYSTATPVLRVGSTSSLGHLTGHQVAEDVTIGPPWPLPAQLQ